ncbi:MAG TPA: SDR family oxidoreductase [Pseudorhodoplanes sp.]|jgi:NAD(P)-dependent dehydrogenase (short-subunit alcohol dehydrogenase family)|nr:SDR family oxidoreductase [Pseudorhodoplanes sp.]
MRLANKVAIVTGAGAGIGAATAELFAREGARVLVADYDEASAKKVAGRIGEAAVAVRADVRLNADAKAISDRCMEAFGRIDILVNNAGRGILGTVVTTDEKDWDDIVAVNLKSVFLCSKHAIPLMARNGGGAIVNLASTVAIAGIPDRAAYVAAKGGVAALTRAMALDHVGEGIRVNAVQPGVVWSTYFDKMLTQVPDPEAFKQGLRDRAPMGRVGRPEEIALAILYLASDESAFATGTMLTIDGGYTAR